MSHPARYRGDIPSNSFVLNAKLALRLAGDDAHMVANIQADRATGGRFNLRQKSGGTLVRPLSKAGGWARIPELDDPRQTKKMKKASTETLKRQPSDSTVAGVGLFLRRSLQGLKKRECANCKTPISGQVVRLDCGHHYDTSCLLNLVKTCVRNESQFPPKCCQQPIPKATFDPFMDTTLALVYTEKTIEFSTPRRVYCAKLTCRRFLGAEGKGPHHVYRCPHPACGTTTCSRCKLEVKEHLAHACRPDVPRRPSLQGQKTPVISHTSSISRPAPLLAKTVVPAPPVVKPVTPAPVAARASASQSTVSLGRPAPPPPLPLKRSSVLGKAPPPPPPPLKKPVLQIQNAPPVRVVDRPRAPPPPPPPAASKFKPKPPPPPPPPRSSTLAPLLVARHEREGASWIRSQPPHPAPLPPQQHRRDLSSAPAQPPAREAVVFRGAYNAPERRAPVKPRSNALAQIDTLKAKEARNTADSHLLTALEEQVDNMIRTVGYYPCRHEWKVDVSRQICDTCGRKTSVLFRCSLCVTRSCKRCKQSHP